MDETKVERFAPSFVIDEEPELETDIEISDISESDWVETISRKFAKGYTNRTIITLTCTSFNMLMLLLPYSVKICGVLPTTIILTFVWVSSLLTLLALLKVVLKTNKLTYRELVFQYLGKVQIFLFEIFNILYHFFKIPVYQIIHYEIMLFLINFIRKEEIPLRWWEKALTIFLPNILYLFMINFKKICDSSFVYKLGAGTIIIFFLVILIKLPFVNFENDKVEKFNLNKASKSFLYCYGVLSNIFCSHFMLFDSMSQFILRTSKRSTSVLLWSQNIRSFCVVLFMVIGFFTSVRVKSYSMLILDGTNIVFILVKILLLIVVTILIPSKLSITIEGIYTFNKAPTGTKNIPQLFRLLAGFFLLIFSDVLVFFITQPIFFFCFLGGICSSVLFYYLPIEIYSAVIIERGVFYYSIFVTYVLNVLIGIILFISAIVNIKWILVHQIME